MLVLENQIKYPGWTIEQTAKHLRQSSDQINALTQAKIGQFSLDILIVMLDRAGRTVKVEICPPGSKSAIALFFPKTSPLSQN